jgi:omega-6 fatty acid desaturase (delta-12 desaturase)
LYLQEVSPQVQSVANIAISFDGAGCYRCVRFRVAEESIQLSGRKAVPDAVHTAPAHANRPEGWRKVLARHSRPHPGKSWWQVVNSVTPFFALWVAMYASLSYSYWLTLLLAIPAAGFLVRIFIIQHDCGHHAFFRSRRANEVLGSLCGVLTATPFHFWRRTHARHHVTSGNLSHRGHGDVCTLTVNEYLARSPWRRLCYRVYRHPLFMFFLGASYLFAVRQRFTWGMPRTWARERRSVHATNLALLLLLVAAACTIGLRSFLLIEAPIFVLGAAIGSWLFFVQHQFEEAYWQPDQSWDATRSALHGSSYYRLPRVLQWFTGNIGYHHIHHLNSRIPNYNLPACYDDEPAFREAVTFGLRESFRCASLKLWDEESQRLVTFAEAHTRVV